MLQIALFDFMKEASIKGAKLRGAKFVLSKLVVGAYEGRDMVIVRRQAPFGFALPVAVGHPNIGVAIDFCEVAKYIIAAQCVITINGDNDPIFFGFTNGVVDVGKHALSLPVVNKLYSVMEVMFCKVVLNDVAGSICR